MQHTERMRPILLSSVTCLALPYFFILPHERHDLREVKVKVKCTLVQTQRLCTGRTAHRGSRGIALLFCDHGTRREWGFSFTPRPLFNPGKYTLPIVQEVGWVSGLVWTGAENFASTEILSPHRAARSQLLYRLSYRGPHLRQSVIEYKMCFDFQCKFRLKIFFILKGIERDIVMNIQRSSCKLRETLLWIYRGRHVNWERHCYEYTEVVT